MSLIVEQMAVKRLPSELVNNAAFVKMVDFDPVHESDAPAGPAEQQGPFGKRHSPDPRASGRPDKGPP